MSVADFSERLERLGTIDQNVNNVARAELEYSDAMGQIYNYIEAVARDEVSTEILNGSHDIDTGVDREEIAAAIKENREALLARVEEAVSKRKEVLRALHQSELRRNQLFASPSDD